MSRIKNSTARSLRICSGARCRNALSQSSGGNTAGGDGGWADMSHPWYDCGSFPRQCLLVSHAVPTVILIIIILALRYVSCDNVQWVQVTVTDVPYTVKVRHGSLQDGEDREQRARARVHAARPAAHFSSIKYNLSPRPSKNVVCNSDLVQWGTIEAWVAPSIENTFHAPVTSSSATGCDEWAKARWWTHFVSLGASKCQLRIRPLIVSVQI